MNGEAALRVRVTAGAADNTIARVVKLVEEAQESKAPTEALHRPLLEILQRLPCWSSARWLRSSRRFFFGGDWSAWIYKGLAVLLIAALCAGDFDACCDRLGAFVRARRGLLMKGGAVLESLGKITTAAMDKTGTLRPPESRR